MKYAKIEITAEIELKSGLHIGASDAFAAIGATDSPVTKDPLTKRPVIPGSSIKGKMRALLNRSDAQLKPHSNANDDHEEICQLFGSSGGKNGVLRSRLVFTDSLMTETEAKRLTERAKSTTEVKFENTIDRLTAVANPRQIERVIAGAKFPFSLVYEIGPVSKQKEGEELAEYPTKEQILNDFQLIASGLKLLEYDYLGGSGTRGYGRLKFNNLQAKIVVGELTGDDGLTIEDLQRELQEV